MFTVAVFQHFSELEIFQNKVGEKMDNLKKRLLIQEYSNFHMH